MPYLELEDETELYFNDWGTGEPVVLIHGWPLSSAMWEHQADFLVENGYCVVAYDRCGFGKSSQPLDGHNYDRLTDDLAELLAALDLTGATLVGFSSVTPFLLKTHDNPGGTEPAVFDQFRACLRKDRFAFLNDFGPPFYGRSLLHHTVSEPMLNWTFALAIQASLKATVDDVTAFSSTDFRQEMTLFATPFLVIHGTADTTVPIDGAGRAAAKILPNATLIEYDGEPHGLFATAPDRLNADLLAFLGGDRKATQPINS